ncbi:protein of unknown function [Paraburkholderia kururiensis]
MGVSSCGGVSTSSSGGGGSWVLECVLSVTGFATLPLGRSASAARFACASSRPRLRSEGAVPIAVTPDAPAAKVAFRCLPCVAPVESSPASCAPGTACAEGGSTVPVSVPGCFELAGSGFAGPGVIGMEPGKDVETPSSFVIGWNLVRSGRIGPRSRTTRHSRQITQAAHSHAPVHEALDRRTNRVNARQHAPCASSPAACVRTTAWHAARRGT